MRRRNQGEGSRGWWEEKKCRVSRDREWRDSTVIESSKPQQKQPNGMLLLCGGSE